MQPGHTLLERYRNADTLLETGQLQQAADICRQMLSENPGFAYGYHLMAALFRTTGNLDKALGFCDIAVSLDATVPAFFAQQGQLFFALGRFAEATAAFARARQLDPENSAHLIAEADACARDGDHLRSQALFAEARAMGEVVEADMHEGMILSEYGDIEAADALFDRVIAERPGHYAGYLHKAKTLLARGRDREAEIHYAKALRCDPRHFETLLGLSVVNERQGQIDAAIALAIQAVNAGSAIFDSLLLLGQLLLRKQNWSSAEQIFQQALSVAPEHLLALHGLCSALAAQGKASSAHPALAALLSASHASPALAFFVAAQRGESLAAMPAHYVAALFDAGAKNYSYYLQQTSLYRADMLADALLAVPGGLMRAQASLLDLGCGDGLMGACLAGATQERVGVDLSVGMLEKARQRGCYHALHVLDIGEFAVGCDRRFDLLVALDVLPYLGELTGFFAAVRNVMHGESHFAFTLEKEEKNGRFMLNPSGRFSHALPYIAALLDEHGFEVLRQEEVLLRFDAGWPVKGLMFIAKKMAMH